MQGAACCCCAARVDSSQLGDSSSQAGQRLRDALVALCKGAAQQRSLDRGVGLLLQLLLLLALMVEWHGRCWLLPTLLQWLLRSTCCLLLQLLWLLWLLWWQPGAICLSTRIWRAWKAAAPAAALAGGIRCTRQVRQPRQQHCTWRRLCVAGAGVPAAHSRRRLVAARVGVAAGAEEGAHIWVVGELRHLQAQRA
jgi:hypothetical protein